MKTLKLFLAFLFMLPAAFGQQWSIGYWTPWGNPAVPISRIQWDGLTHIVQWGALVKPDGTLDLTTNNFTANAPALIAAAHQANVKVIVGLTQPYWQGQTTNFQQAATTNRTVFVNNIMNLVNTYGFDGVDIDWEPFSEGSNGTAMTSLISSLRAQLGNRILTAAAIVTDHGYWGSVATQLDRVNVMTYDMSGLWDPYSWHNSSINSDDSQVWSVELAVQRFTARGVPLAKLGIGIPFYGWQWKGGGVSGPRQTWSSNPAMSQVAYHNFDTQITSQNYRWDAVAQAPYLVNNSGAPSYLSYDDERSVAAKVKYAKNKGLGGWIIWALDQDYFPDRTPSHPLMTAVRDAMGTSAPQQTPPVISSASTLAAATQGVAYSQTVQSTGTTPITWSLTSGSLPAGLTLGGSTGVIGGTPTTVGTYSFTLTASNVAGSNSKQFSLTVQALAPTATAPTITTNSTLPGGTTGVPYSLTLAASGTTPIAWSLTSGSLPAGLSLNGTNGVIAGTPSAAGTAAFTVQAKNVAGSNSKQFSLTVQAPAPTATAPTITTNSTLPGGTTGVPYSLTLAASGTTSITWSLTSGSLPAGLSLNGANGVIAGTPSAAGTAAFTVQAKNVAGSNSRAFGLTIGTQTAPSAGAWSIGYWTGSGNPPLPVSDIDWSALTHVVHYSALVNADGTLDLNSYGISSNATALISAAHKGGVKVLLAVSQPVGQGTSGNFYLAATNSQAALISNIMNVVNQYGFDGVDIYWQPFSTGANSTALSAFTTGLRTALGSRTMTAAAIVTDSTFWGAEQAKFDRINVRTFDLTGTWNPYSWHNAALYDKDGQVWSINLAVDRFKQSGVPAAKLGIGIPFFGYQWSGGGVTSPGQVWSTAPVLQSLTYQALASQVTPQNLIRDASGQVPYLSNNAGAPSFLTFDDAESVAAKVNYAKANGLGGWIIWPLEGDYSPTSNPRQPLLAAIKNSLGGVAATAPSLTTNSPLPSGRVGNPYSVALASTGTAPITWSINGGSLPSGVSLNSSTGLISGTPTVAGTFSFTVVATNTAGSVSRVLSLTVEASAPTVNPSVIIGFPTGGNVTSPLPITVTVSASVVRVEYLLNGRPFATATKAPFSYTWDASGVAKKITHYLQAVAYDAKGKSATSKAVKIRFNW